MTIAQQLKIKEFPFKIRDNQGNEVYWEDSNGYWSKREYDNQGNEVYREDSKGYWAKWEYDDQGNEVYWEDSNGVIIDNRPQQNCEGKIIEVDGKKYKLELLK